MGGVPQGQIWMTLFGLSEWWGLTPQMEQLLKKWLHIYQEHHLADGEYLNLYDLAFDKPEAHVIRKDKKLCYAFYTQQMDQIYQGLVELRGLAPDTYRLHDYVNDIELGTVHGPQATLKVEFRGSLLLEAIPQEVHS